MSLILGVAAMTHDTLRPANADIEIAPFFIQNYEQGLQDREAVLVDPASMSHTRLPASQLMREGMQRDYQAEKDFLLAERRILGFMATHAEKLRTGVRYTEMIDELYSMQPPVDDEDYLVKLSRFRKMGILKWGAIGNVRANVVLAEDRNANVAL
jgi:hypothetical protein